jgi:hypothetical protein
MNRSFLTYDKILLENMVSHELDKNNGTQLSEEAIKTEFN